jgi:hypothetical protein
MHLEKSLNPRRSCSCLRSFFYLSFFLLPSVFLCAEAYSQDSSCITMWQPSVQLSPNGEDGQNASVAVQGDTAHFVWSPWNSSHFVPYRRTVDAGVTYEELRELAQLDSGYIAGGGGSSLLHPRLYIFSIRPSVQLNTILICL